jgi:hypothetical protein
MAEIIRLIETPFLSEFDGTVNWLASRGFRNKDRLRVYRDNIQNMSHIASDGDMERAYADAKRDGKLNEILSSYVESIELVGALTCLRNEAVDIPDLVLKRALDGPADAAIENENSNQGRNAMFELSMAAVIAKQGLKPILTTSNPDIHFRFLDRCVSVECKRILSPTKLVKNVSEAVKQLRKSVDLDAKAVGVAAICVSRLCYRGNGFWEVPSADVAQSFLADGLQRIIQRYEPQLKNLVRPWVEGLLFYVSTPVYIQGFGYAPVNAGMVYPMSTKDDYLRSLMSLLRL